MTAAFWVLGVTLVLATGVQAVPAIEGVVDSLDSAPTTIALDKTGVVWRREVRTDLESNFFRLHFSDIVASAGSDFVLRVKDRDRTPVLEVSATALAAGEYWTAYLSGTYALIEVDNRGASAGFTLSLKVADVATQRQGAKVLDIQDERHPKDRPAWFYDTNAGLTAAARSVAKVRYVKDRVMYSCTGFLLSESLMLTNQHCFDTAPVCTTAIAQFGYQQDRDLNVSDGEEFRCAEVKDSDAKLDYTLIRLAGKPGKRWGVLAWGLEAPASATPVYVVQHPGGAPKRVALDGCVVKTADAIAGVRGQTTDFGHICDTEEGSSGSPVLDLRNRVIGLHHLGFARGDPDWNKENRAVKAAVLYERISRFLP